MVVEVDATRCDRGRGKERENGEDETLGEGEGRVGLRGVGLVPQEQEEREVEGEEGGELGVGGGHTVAFAVHFYSIWC